MGAGLGAGALVAMAVAFEGVVCWEAIACAAARCSSAKAAWQGMVMSVGGAWGTLTCTGPLVIWKSFLASF